jgi:hypothetical protein
MPRIDTSSDMYQNRDRSLTTYKKDLDHSVAYKDLPRPDDKQRVRELQQGTTKINNQDGSKALPQRDFIKTERSNDGLATTERLRAEQNQLIEQQRTQALYPPLYEPRKAPPERPVDASSFITGGSTLAGAMLLLPALVWAGNLLELGMTDDGRPDTVWHTATTGSADQNLVTRVCKL